MEKDKKLSQIDEDNYCDLDPTKLCDNCCKCIEGDNTDYMEIKLDGIVDCDDDIDEYILNDDEMRREESTDDKEEYDDNMDADYIEDIPELKEKYDKEIEKIMKK